MAIKQATAAERRHLGRVASVPCVLCARMGLGETKAEVHHLKFGTGASDRADHMLTIALCVRHHRVEYPESVHFLKERGLHLRYKCSELDLLADTLRALEKL